MSSNDKPTKSRGRFLTDARRVVILVTFSAMLLLGYAFRFEIASLGFGVMARDSFDLLFDKTDFPMELTAAPYQMTSIGKRVVAVSETNFQVFNSAGNFVFGERLNFTNPVSSSKGGKLLIYSQGGKNLVLYSGEMPIYTNQTTNAIYTAEIGESGLLAISTGEFGYQSSVKVLGKNFDELFVWLSADCIINNISLSNDGTKMAVSGVMFKNDSLTSKMTVFDINEGKELYNIEFYNMLIVDTKILTDGKVMVVMDGGSAIIGDKGEALSRFDYGTANLSAYAFGSHDSLTLALGDYSAKKRTNLIRLNSKGEKERSTFIGDEVKGVDSYGSGTIVFCHDDFLLYDRDLNLKNKFMAAENSTPVVIDDYVYYATDNQLKRIHMNVEKEK